MLVESEDVCAGTINVLLQPLSEIVFQRKKVIELKVRAKHSICAIILDKQDKYTSSSRFGPLGYGFLFYLIFLFCFNTK